MSTTSPLALLFMGQIHKPIRVAVDKDSTVVVRIHHDASNLPKQAMVDKLQDTMQNEMARHVAPQAIIDTWNWRHNAGGDIMGLMRINADHLLPLMQQSGLQGVWVETPLSHRHLFAPIWLSSPQCKLTQQERLPRLRLFRNPWASFGKPNRMAQWLMPSVLNRMNWWLAKRL